MYNRRHIFRKRLYVYEKKKKFLTCKNGTIKSSKELEEIAKNTLEILTTIKGMTFQNALKFIMKYLDIVEKDITDLPNDASSLSRRQLERYKNGEIKTLNTNMIVAICISLKLPLIISLTLINLAGFSITNTYEDVVLAITLYVCNDHSFDEINSMLGGIGINKLTMKR